MAQLSAWHSEECCANAAQVSARPPWFLSLMYVEVFAQLPLFIVGAYAFAARKEWIRTPALVYSISTVATMVRCVCQAASDAGAPLGRYTLAVTICTSCLCTCCAFGGPGMNLAASSRCAWIEHEIACSCLQVPILGELAMTPAKVGYHRTAVLACYLPFLVMPLLLAARLLTAGPQLFPRPSRPRYKNR